MIAHIALGAGEHGIDLERPVALAAAVRPAATVTELAFMPDELSDGSYLLQLQAPALGGDAVPSRPLLYRLQASAR